MSDFVRPFIREDDTTTAGGVVQAGVIRTVTVRGKMATYHGDPVACPACNTVGRTECVQPYMPNTGPDGRQRSLDGDICRCGCVPAPRLKALHNNELMGFSKAYAAKKFGCEGWLAYAGHETDLTGFDEFFVVHDSATGKPFSGYAYGLKSHAGTHEGELSENGATVKAYGVEGQEVQLVYLLQTRIGVRE